MDEIEIPEAIRENNEIPQKSSSSYLSLIVGAVLFLGVTGIVLVFLSSANRKSDQTTQDESVSVPAISQQTKTVPAKQEPNSKTIIPPETEVAPTTPSQDNLLGHLPYEVANPTELVSITDDATVMMRPSAAQKFLQMQAAAKADGIDLVPISAFRTVEAQEQLFFGVKEQRVQDAAKRAEVSAPPGYSEHHTGYAVDIGDGTAPATHVEKEFEQTAAFKWLQQNALKYSFELSFPPDNEQGVSYEPWHWRFVGDRDSLETFYKVRN